MLGGSAGISAKPRGLASPQCCHQLSHSKGRVSTTPRPDLVTPATRTVSCSRAGLRRENPIVGLIERSASGLQLERRDLGYPIAHPLTRLGVRILPDRSKICSDAESNGVMWPNRFTTVVRMWSPPAKRRASRRFRERLSASAMALERPLVVALRL